MAERRYRTAPLGAVLVWLALLLVAPARAADAPYLQTLIARAEARKLAESAEWAHLLHIEASAFGRRRSAVRSAWFFVSPDGAHDPAAELRATLAAFFDPKPRAPRGEPAQCIYGARLAWLDAQLQFDDRRLPRQPCPAREQWQATLAPEQVWMVFPSAYVNSPASMFGHTLLRIDGPEARAGTPLLAYAVNYAADTGETDGLLFALKGLVGGYLGQFSVLPYYDKVKEYARLESRDIWEYPLDLSPAARERLLLHLWELRGVGFTYYFFTRNCSYQLLTLLRVAEPAIDWGRQFAGWAIPTDTVRVLGDRLGAPQFRPSLATTIAARGAALTAETLAQSVALAEGRLDPAATDAPAAGLSLANDQVQYRNADGALPREIAIPRSLALLRARAATGEKSAPVTVAAPTVDPASGHDTARVSAGIASDPHGDGASLRLNVRPAYHDLLDPPGGYGPGQQIVFAELGLRTRLANGATALDHVTLVDIVSVAPRDALFQPVSWRFRAAHERPDLGVGRDPRLTVLEGGAGLATGRFGAVVGYGYALVRAEVGAARDETHALQLGPQLGVLAEPLPGWSLQAEASWLPGLAGDRADRRTITVGQQWQLHRAIGLRLSASALWLGTAERQQIELHLLHYF